jgi:hypothetical protein
VKPHDTSALQELAHRAQPSIEMGMFPYHCIVCGGGYKRCGRTHDHLSAGEEPCQGDQFCWQDKCVVFIDPTDVQSFMSDQEDLIRFVQESTAARRHYRGTYAGYGEVQLTGRSTDWPTSCMVADRSKAQFVAGWLKHDDHKRSGAILVRIVCADCWHTDLVPPALEISSSSSPSSSSAIVASHVDHMGSAEAASSSPPRKRVAAPSQHAAMQPLSVTTQVATLQGRSLEVMTERTRDGIRSVIVLHEVKGLLALEDGAVAEQHTRVRTCVSTRHPSHDKSHSLLQTHTRCLVCLSVQRTHIHTHTCIVPLQRTLTLEAACLCFFEERARAN